MEELKKGEVGRNEERRSWKKGREEKLEEMKRGKVGRTEVRRSWKK